MRETILTMSDPVPPFDELPELMLSLRTFGSRRRRPEEPRGLDVEEGRFFGPILDARRAAAVAVTRVQVVGAFDARRIGALLDATIRAYATERFQTRAPARRALEAELFEIVEPLRAALRELRERAETVGSSREPEAQYAYWAQWLDQLRTTFRTADSVWPPLAEALAAAPPPETGNRRREESR